jgi:hypothetical protein
MLPIGIQDFETLRSGGYIYVDKTEPIYRLTNVAKYLFLSRPRRFGKSLLVSTLKAIFEGKKELFGGLWIEERHPFTPHPVIHLDFSQLNFSNKPLELALLERFQFIAQDHGFSLKAKYAKDAFEELIRLMSAKGKVVVLVDEYDKPLTDYLDKPDRREENQETLKSVYSLLKPMNPFLHLVLLTGVSKFGKLSLFSDLNNLVDISLVPEFALMLGYTRQEIERHFQPYLDKAAKRQKLSLEQLWESMQLWYNGYSWDGENKVYCPYSMLTFFNNPVFKGYWYETGTPTFLLKLIKEKGIEPFDLEHLSTSDEIISVADIEQLDPISIMFQTGYLTIQSQEQSSLGVSYELSYPNQEVRQAFSNGLLQQYTFLLPSKSRSMSLELRRALQRQDWDAFFKTINQTFASVPYQVFKVQESYFHSLMHLMLVATGYPVRSEESTNKGRMDTVVEMPEWVVIFEFKLEGTPQRAIQQIKDEGYAAKFNKQVKLIGVVFDPEARQVGAWAVE